MPSQMHKARTRDLYTEVEKKLIEICGWDSKACKFKMRKGRPKDAPDFVCTSSVDADKVVRAAACLHQLSKFEFTGGVTTVCVVASHWVALRSA